MYKYVGDPRHNGHGPEVLNLYGHRFVKGEPVKIDDVVIGAVKVSKAKIEAKLAGNSHFAEVDGRGVKVKKDGD